MGNDTLRGQGGRDLLILAANEGSDTIQNFEVGRDRIGLADGLSFADITLSGNDIISGSETLATFNNISAESLSENDFVIV